MTQSTRTSERLHFNRFLASLSTDAKNRLMPQLELVFLPLGKILYEPGDLLRHVYFPIDSTVSLLYVMENGASGEVAVVGNDGIVGFFTVMGGDRAPSRAIVQGAGTAYRMPASRLKEEFQSVF